MNAPLLAWRHVTVRFGSTEAVRDVSLSLAPGEILGIVGESGSGKTTLLRAAMGLLTDGGQVTGGDITLCGNSLLSLSTPQRRAVNGPRLGMVFQSAGSSFCPVRTVASQLCEILAQHGVAGREARRKRAMDMLESLSFDNPSRVMESYPFQLSGGMQQRVGIAAAMLLQPDALLADEPTSALDAAIQRQVIDTLRLTRDRFGTGIVIVTHNIGVVEALANRVAVMRGGELVEEGSTEELLHHPQQPYTQALMEAVPRLHPHTPSA